MSDDRSAEKLAFRKVAGLFATGVTVVTTRMGEKMHGMTANAFTSLSLEPMLVLVCVDLKAHMHHLLEESGIFAVSILCDEQGDLSRYFSSKERPLFIHEFDEVEHAHAVTGAPILTGCLAYFDCRVTMKHDGGDHTIFVGQVETFGVDDTRDPLLFYRGHYATILK
jgi:flavin reductase (DIM6/NTAB) family NADH-FMN oxidoreductase RutF